MKLEFQFFDDSECEFNDSMEVAKERVLKVRLDKWLWAARFFTTLALARAAVDAGKVFYDGERSKASREIELGAELLIRQGRFEKTVIVKGLSTRRRSTDEAAQLYEETEISKTNRAQQQAQQDFQSQGDNFNAYQQDYSKENYPRGYPQDYSVDPDMQNYYPEQRERRATRFLRRSFMRQPTNARPDQRPAYGSQQSQESQESQYTPHCPQYGSHQSYQSHQSQYTPRSPQYGSHHSHQSHQSQYTPRSPQYGSHHSHQSHQSQYTPRSPQYGSHHSHQSHQSQYTPRSPQYGSQKSQQSQYAPKCPQYGSQSQYAPKCPQYGSQSQYASQQSQELEQGCDNYETSE